MARPAAHSAAALRVLRTAAGRRALQGALLVGGLFALGLLFGGQAQAADGASASTVSSLSALSASSAPSAPALTAAEAPAKTAPSEPSAPSALSAPSVPSVSADSGAPAVPVGGKVVRFAGDVVSAVTEELAAAQVDVPPASSSPSLPSLPDLLGLPTLPSTPSLPSLPTSPGEQSGGTLPVPAVSMPEQGSGVTPSSDRGASVESAAATSSYGPWGAVSGAEAGVAVHGGAHGAAHVGHVPAHRAPAGDPGGVLGNAPVIDSGSSRHCDAHAVTPYDGVALRLVSGGAVRTDAAGTQDRYRDIPVFPG